MEHNLPSANRRTPALSDGKGGLAESASTETWRCRRRSRNSRAPLTAAGLFESARKQVHLVKISTPVLEHVYGNTCFPSIPFSEWKREVTLALAIEQALRRFAAGRRLEFVKSLIDEQTKAAVVRQLRSKRGALVIGYHGGFPVLRLLAFRGLFPRGVILASNGRYAAADGAFALFAAREALLARRPVLMAPDGRFGKATVTITVLGAQLAMADGAPFLAYTTRCDTVWLSVVRTDNGFTLKTTDGPQAEEAEAFADFRDRFFRFFVDQAELSLRGDPRNQPIGRNWIETFEAMLAGRVDAFRRPSR